MSDYDSNIYPPPTGANPYFGGYGTYPTATPGQYAGDLSGMGQFGANVAPQSAPGSPNSAVDNFYKQPGINPGFAKSITELQKLKQQQAQLNQQLKQADAIRQMGADSSRSIAAPGRAAAPNWAGGAANIFSSYLAGKMQGDAKDKLEAMGGTKSKAVFDYYKALEANPDLAKVGPSVSDYFS